jgi:hypothetical protein
MEGDLTDLSCLTSLISAGREALIGNTLYVVVGIANAGIGTMCILDNVRTGRFHLSRSEMRNNRIFVPCLPSDEQSLETFIYESSHQC